jgi:hypothetical protein
MLTTLTTAHDFSTISLGSLLTTPLPLLPRHFLEQHKLPLSGPGWLSSSWVLLVSLVVCDRQWLLAVHSALWARQRELTCCLPFPSCFLYSQKIREADFSACQLLSGWFLAWIILRSWRWRWHFPPKRRFTFNGLNGVYHSTNRTLQWFISSYYIVFVSRSRMVELYRQSPIRLHGVVLN